MMFRGARLADVGPAKFSDLQVSAQALDFCLKGVGQVQSYLKSIEINQHRDTVCAQGGDEQVHCHCSSL